MDACSNSGGHGSGRRGTETVEGHAVTAFLHRVDGVLVRLAWVPRTMILIAVAIVLFEASDRKPPFQVLSVEPASARPGDTVVITSRVWRDSSRNCSAHRSRSMFDAAMVRYDYPKAIFSDAAIDRVERGTPGVLRVAVAIPLSAEPGPASVVSVTQYRCNRVHSLWPIDVTTVMPFTILP
jgi:hypothetical protein